MEALDAENDSIARARAKFDNIFRFLAQPLVDFAPPNSREICFRASPTRSAGSAETSQRKEGRP